MNKQQAEQILMKLISDIPMKRQDYLLLEEAIRVLKSAEVSSEKSSQLPPTLERSRGI